MTRLHSHNSHNPPPLKRLPSINPGAFIPEPTGAIKKALETGYNRLFLGAALFGIAFVTIALRLTWVTLVATPGTSNLVRHISQPALPRADIVDRNDVVLATSLTTSSLYANAKQIHDPQSVADDIIKLFPDLNKDLVLGRLTSGKGFVWIKRNVTPREQQAILRLGIPGLYFQNEIKRVYPQGNLTAHLVGFTDVDNNGIAGIEKSFDDDLSRGQNPVVLSLDIRVQHILHEELSKAIADFTAIGGAGAVMDLRTGEIIAMVSLPDFDPAMPSEANDDQRFNRVTLGVYEMGSTFKIFNTAIALDSGVSKINQVYDASSAIRIGGFTINDYHGKQRPLNISEIFTYSSNIGSAKMADAFGPEIQQTYLQRLGLLSASPIELPEIGQPLFPSAKNWRRINTMTISFGHGISVSPAQMLAAVGAVANHGLWRAPTLLRRDGSNIPDGQRVISEDTSTKLRQMMRLVVEMGTGKKADVAGYLVGGKTGTADKQKGRGYDENARMASFTSIFPVNNPRYAALVMVDEPKPNAHSHGYATGGWVAAPAIANIVTRMAPLYGLSPVPDNSPDQVNPLAVNIAEYNAQNKPSNGHVDATKVKLTIPEVPLAVE